MLENSWSLNTLLIAAGVITTVPLLLFTEAAQHLRLSTLGFFQYIGPTLMFILATMVYGEQIDAERLVTFRVYLGRPYLIYFRCTLHSATFKTKLAHTYY